MEGLPGINAWHQVNDRDQRFLGKYLTETLEWVIDGIRESEFDSDVEQILVCDSHALGENIPYDFTEYDDRIYLIRGGLRDYYMMAGIDSTFTTVFFVGYHAGVGSIHGNMDHTYSSATVHEIRINGFRMNETTINASFAGNLGVPVSLVIGDHALAEELKPIMPDTVLVETKEGLSRFSAIMKPKNVVKKNVIEATKAALKKTVMGTVSLYKLEPPYSVDINFNSTEMADESVLIPGVERISGQSIRYGCDSFPELLQTLLAVVYSARLGTEKGK